MVEELSGVQRSKDTYSGVFKRPSFFVDHGTKGKSVQTTLPTLHLWPSNTSLSTKNGCMNHKKDIKCVQSALDTCIISLNVSRSDLKGPCACVFKDIFC